EADLGVASGNGKGQIFVKGEVIKTVPEEEIVQTLLAEANRMAEDMDAETESGSVAVSVSSGPACMHGAARITGVRVVPAGPGAAQSRYAIVARAIEDPSPPQASTRAGGGAGAVLLLR